jgi:hypothetical protein
VLDPDAAMNKARANLDHLRRVHPSGMAARWLAQWQDIVDLGVDAVLDTLTSTSPRAVELRQNSPFAGVLPDGERQAALAAFRTHWLRNRAT